jgi:hypothetical protein
LGSAGYQPAGSPFSFPIYASVIKESMMLEDSAAALERIYYEMYSKVESAAARIEPKSGQSERGADLSIHPSPSASSFS